jgi:hypothetical protein
MDPRIEAGDATVDLLHALGPPASMASAHVVFSFACLGTSHGLDDGVIQLEKGRPVGVLRSQRLQGFFDAADRH